MDLELNHVLTSVAMGRLEPEEQTAVNNLPCGMDIVESAQVRESWLQIRNESPTALCEPERLVSLRTRYSHDGDG